MTSSERPGTRGTTHGGVIEAVADRHAADPDDAIDDHGVTTLELFFDLVFVFAFVQDTQLMSAQPTAGGAVRGAVVFSLMWWAWCSYAWLGNHARADRGVVRAAMLAAMAVMFIVALTIPESFDDMPGGLFAPFVFAACYALVRFLHLACYWALAREDAGLRRQLLITAPSITCAAALLVVGGVVGPPYQSALWALALAVDYLGIWVAGTSGWRLPSARHFSERFGLVVIVALGESLVSIGVGVAERAVSWPVVVGSTLGIAVTVALWWLYFDSASAAGEHRLTRASAAERSRLGRDAYTYLHFPIVASILFVALGLKKAMSYVSDTEHHTLTEPLTGMPLVSLYAGVAVYLLGNVAFQRRTGARWAVHLIIVALALLAVLPVASRLPAMAAMAVVAAALTVAVMADLSRRGS